MVNKGSNFADFVRFRQHNYARTQQSLLQLWAAIIEKPWKNMLYEKSIPSLQNVGY